MSRLMASETMIQVRDATDNRNPLGTYYILVDLGLNALRPAQRPVKG
jgi:hypothetical protein